jgi:hypothetical protein
MEAIDFKKLSSEGREWFHQLINILTLTWCSMAAVFRASSIVGQNLILGE